MNFGVKNKPSKNIILHKIFCFITASNVVIFCFTTASNVVMLIKKAVLLTLLAQHEIFKLNLNKHFFRSIRVTTHITFQWTEQHFKFFIKND